MKYIFYSILVFFLAWQTSFAQHGTGKSCYAISVNDSFASIKANVYAGKQSATANKDQNYYWYASNKIMETRGGYDGKLLHGDYSSFYLNNNLKEKGKFKLGQKLGRWTTWYDNGKIKEVSWYRHGSKRGTQELYDRNGLLQQKADYVNDLLDGKLTTFKGDSVFNTRNFKNGVEVPFIENKKMDGFSSMKQRIKKIFVKKEKKAARPSNQVEPVKVLPVPQPQTKKKKVEPLKAQSPLTNKATKP
jgi:hypothetical protein